MKKFLLFIGLLTLPIIAFAQVLTIQPVGIKTVCLTDTVMFQAFNPMPDSQIEWVSVSGNETSVESADNSIRFTFSATKLIQGSTNFIYCRTIQDGKILQESEKTEISIPSPTNIDLQLPSYFQGDLIYLNPGSNVENHSWEWNFMEDYCNYKEAVFYARRAGDHSIDLRVYDESGCLTELSFPVTIISKPVVGVEFITSETINYICANRDTSRFKLNGFTFDQIDSVWADEPGLFNSIWESANDILNISWDTEFSGKTTIHFQIGQNSSYEKELTSEVVLIKDPIPRSGKIEESTTENGLLFFKKDSDFSTDQVVFHWKQSPKSNMNDEKTVKLEQGNDGTWCFFANLDINLNYYWLEVYYPETSCKCYRKIEFN